MTAHPPRSQGQRHWIDTSAAALIVCSGVLCLLQSVLPHAYEMAPLLIGLGLLLLNHARQQPMRILYLTLLLLMPRVYLQGDERYLFSEISLFDYILIAISFAASHRLPMAFWQRLLPAAAIALPLGCLITYQQRSGPALVEPFNAGSLSINQTALLMGACLSLSLCFLWDAVTARRPARRRIGLSALWSLASVLALAMVLSTHSRFGVGLSLLATAIILAVANQQRLHSGLQQLSSALERGASHLGLAHPAAWSRRILSLSGLGVLAATAAALAIRIYSNPLNQVSDVHRLYLLRCYFSVPFSGHNRLIYGMGFTRPSQTVCKDIGLIKGTSHAHNLFAQVAADNGLIAMLAIMAIAAWALKRCLSMAWRSDQPAMIGSAALTLFLLASLQIEGGWGKVSWIQALMGLALGSLTMLPPPSRPVTALPTPAEPDPGKTWSGS